MLTDVIFKGILTKFWPRPNLLSFFEFTHSLTPVYIGQTNADIEKVLR